MIRKAAIVSISGITLKSQEITMLKKGHPWGVILFKRNVLSEIQLMKLTKKIRFIMKDKKFPILIDEEGGRVSRLCNYLDNSFFTQKYLGNIYKSDKLIGYLYFILKLIYFKLKINQKDYYDGYCSALKNLLFSSAA